MIDANSARTLTGKCLCGEVHYAVADDLPQHDGLATPGPRVKPAPIRRRQRNA